MYKDYEQNLVFNTPNDSTLDVSITYDIRVKARNNGVESTSDFKVIVYNNIPKVLNPGSHKTQYILKTGAVDTVDFSNLFEDIDNDQLTY